MDMIARLRSHEPLELTPENIEEVYRTTRYMCSFDDWGGLEACVLRQRERAHETGQWLDETCLEMFLVARAVPLCTISAERFVTPMPGIDQKASRDRKARLIQACAIVVNELLLEWRRAHLFPSTIIQNGSAIPVSDKKKPSAPSSSSSTSSTSTSLSTYSVFWSLFRSVLWSLSWSLLLRPKAVVACDSQSHQ